MLLSLLACRPANDRQEPEVYWQQPEEGIVLHDGDTLPWQLTLVDNWDLASYELALTPSFDSLTRLDLILPGISRSLVKVISGNTFFVDTLWQLPDSAAAGTYMLQVSGIDEAENITTLTRQLTVQSQYDGAAPTIDSLQLPDSLQVGTPLPVYLEISDTVELAYTTLLMQRAAAGTLQADSTFVWTGTQGIISFNWPLQLTAGLYTLRIIVVDWANNRRSQSFNLLVYV